MIPVIRSVNERDFPEIERLLGNWMLTDALLKNFLSNDNAISNVVDRSISVLEIEGSIEGVSLWSRLTNGEITVAGYSVTEKAKRAALDVKFLKQEILEWAKLKITKVSLTAPETEAHQFMNTLRSCGFVCEGVSWSTISDQPNSIRLCKKLVYETIHDSNVLKFLEETFISWGYETRVDTDTLFYRSKADYQLPFLFTAWHTIARQGTQIIVSPPARPLDPYELETLFFPLIVTGHQDKPLLVTIDKKRAVGMIELPQPERRNDNLFIGENVRSQKLGRNLVYTFPTGFQKIRKGLPVLFYVNRVGAVGEARIESWSFEDPKKLCKALYDDEKYDLDHIMEHAEVSGPKAGKVLVLGYEYYRAFNNPVMLGEMKRLDMEFNPQRQRSISYDFFQSVSETGNQQIIDHDTQAGSRERGELDVDRI